MKQLFLIIGAPGSGITTDANLIAKRNCENIAHYSTGELLRQEAESGSELGKTIDSYVTKGKLVPIEIALNTIVGAIKNNTKNVILIDGFPRSVKQMTTLDEILSKETDIELTSIIEVTVSEKTAFERVMRRARDREDNEKVFKKRMQIYLEPLEEIREYYNINNLLTKIDGERTIEEVVLDMEKYIKSNIYVEEVAV